MNLSSIYLGDKVDIKRSKIATGILWLFQISGIVGILLGFKDWFIEKTPLNLLVQLVLVFWVFSIFKGEKIRPFLLITALGMLVEIIGTATGFPFGVYHYGFNLGPKILGVPFLIGCNWAVLVFVTANIAGSLTSTTWLRAFIGAFLMLLLDIPLELIAPNFDFWYFKEGVGINNFISWFSFAFLFHWIYIPFSIEEKSSFSLHFYLSQLLFFTIFSF